MAKIDFGDVCGRYLSSRFAKQSDPSGKHSLNAERIANEHKRHTILTQKLLFKPYKKNPLEQLRRRYTTLSMPVEKADLVPTVAKSPKANGSAPVENRSSLMMNWELLKERGSGLVNLGNTCFMNASLQCLANTPPLVQWLLSTSHQQTCRMKSDKQSCLFCEAERIVKSIHSKSAFSSSSSAANPSNLARRIKEISKTFKFGRQEDASEFLICLIDKIVEACLRSSQPPERLRPSSGTSYEQLCHSQTILHDLFALVLRSRVVCSRCHFKSDTFEVQYTWIVGVRHHTDLRQSLQQFVCQETLAGENLYRCMKCKQMVPAKKRYTLHKAPKVLLINLKRFEFGKNSHKLSHSVRYPEHLNVSPYMSDESSHDQVLTYRLYAVLVHVGSSMHSGHYYSYVRSPNNRWYRADDSCMSLCDLSQVLAQHGAYILCYIQETKPPTPMTNGNSSATATSNNNAKFFTSQPTVIKTAIAAVNGHTNHVKPVPLTLTKPTIVTSHSSSTNGHGPSSTDKREAHPTSIPIKSTPVGPKLLTSTSSNSTSNGHCSKPSTSNGHASVSNSSHQNGHRDASDFDEPVKKKQRMEEGSLSASSSSSGDQSPASSILSKKHQKKKAKKMARDFSLTHHNGISSHSSLSLTNGNPFQQKKQLTMLSPRERL